MMTHFCNSLTNGDNFASNTVVIVYLCLCHYFLELCPLVIQNILISHVSAVLTQEHTGQLSRGPTSIEIHAIKSMYVVNSMFFNVLTQILLEVPI